MTLRGQRHPVADHLAPCSVLHARWPLCPSVAVSALTLPQALHNQCPAQSVKNNKSTALQLQQVFGDSLLRQSVAVACGQPIEMLANGHCIELLLAARSQPTGVL